MKKSSLCLLFMSGATIFLSACGTMNSLHDTIANAQLQKKQLANGNTVYLDYNLAPTASWSCTQVGDPQSYNWALLQTQAEFHLTSGYVLLTEKALNYANQENLNTNYINLQIPTEKTFTTGYGRVSDSLNLNPNAQAVAVYYQCQAINPEHKIGWQKREDVGISVDK